LEGGNFTTLSVDEIYKEGDEWANKIDTWHRERKSPNLEKLRLEYSVKFSQLCFFHYFREARSKLEALEEGSSVQIASEAKKSLDEVKDSMFHWIFFAKVLFFFTWNAAGINTSY
jgi:hypothetical protein